MEEPSDRGIRTGLLVVFKQSRGHLVLHGASTSSGNRAVRMNLRLVHPAHVDLDAIFNIVQCRWPAVGTGDGKERQLQFVCYFDLAAVSSPPSRTDCDDQLTVCCTSSSVATSTTATNCGVTRGVEALSTSWSHEEDDDKVMEAPSDSNGLNSLSTCAPSSLLGVI